jgi:hypothetical protein
MNFDSEPSAVSSSKGEGVTGSENEPVWMRCSLICLVSISCATECDFQSLCPGCSVIAVSFQRAASTHEARSIQDTDDLLDCSSEASAERKVTVCVQSRYVEYDEEGVLRG